MILGVDHILIVVEDLGIATEIYQKMGFQVLPGGEHPKMGTHNALVPLADGTYLELIGFFDTALAESADPDLLIRTGGEMRISNFLLWQTAYTELYFTSVLWPDFDEQALDEAIAAYQSRDRRHGRTSEQLKETLNA